MSRIDLASIGLGAADLTRVAVMVWKQEQKVGKEQSRPSGIMLLEDIIAEQRMTERRAVIAQQPEHEKARHALCTLTEADIKTKRMVG